MPIPHRLSLRGRLNLMIGLAMLCILAIGFLFSLHEARRSVLAEAQATVSLALQLMEPTLGNHRASSGLVTVWLTHLSRLERTRHLRIVVFDGDGQPQPPNLSGTPSPPSVPGWFRWAVAPEPIVVERHLRDANQASLTLRIEAMADDEISEAWAETRGFLLVLLALAGAVYGLVHVIVGRAYQALETILDGLATIEKGAFDKRLPRLSLPEFDRISVAFNHMASALGAAREENQALIRHALAIQEEERRNLARELHDEFGQCLTAIKVMSATLRAPEDTPEAAANQIMGLCDRLFGAVRAMLRRLRPSVLDDLGFAASLEDLAEQWQTSHPELAIHVQCDAAADELGGDTALQIFRIVQEALTNAVKHAAAQHCQVHLAVQNDRSIALTIRDDGRGFAADRPNPGFGLRGIRERVAGLGGRFWLDTCPGQGVILHIVLPARASQP